MNPPTRELHKNCTHVVLTHRASCEQLSFYCAHEHIRVVSQPSGICPQLICPKGVHARAGAFLLDDRTGCCTFHPVPTTTAPKIDEGHAPLPSVEPEPITHQQGPVETVATAQQPEPVATVAKAQQPGPSKKTKQNQKANGKKAPANPVTAAPIAQQPAAPVEVVNLEDPVTEAPVPVTAAPIAQQPAVNLEDPVTEAPIPVTAAPIAQQPAAQIAQQPAAQIAQPAAPITRSATRKLVPLPNSKFFHLHIILSLCIDLFVILFFFSIQMKIPIQ